MSTAYNVHLYSSSAFFIKSLKPFHQPWKSSYNEKCNLIYSSLQPSLFFIHLLPLSVFIFLIAILIIRLYNTNWENIAGDNLEKRKCGSKGENRRCVSGRIKFLSWKVGIKGKRRQIEQIEIKSGKTYVWRASTVIAQKDYEKRWRWK